MSLVIDWRETACIITFSRPEKRNALTRGDYEKINKALAVAAIDDKIKAVVFTATGDFFCAGHDVNEFFSQEFGADHPVIDFLNALIRFPKILIAAVNGNAIGIGFTFLLHCDFIISVMNAEFSAPFVALGLCPEAGATFLLERIVGRARANEALLLGRPLPASSLYGTLLYDFAEDATELRDKTTLLLQNIDEAPLYALRTTKDLLSSDKEKVIERIVSEAENFMALLSYKNTQALIRNKFGLAAPPEPEPEDAPPEEKAPEPEKDIVKPSKIALPNLSASSVRERLLSRRKTRVRGG